MAQPSLADSFRCTLPHCWNRKYRRRRFVDASQHELWAYEGGGIYRHVWLETAGIVSVTPWGFNAQVIPNGTVLGTNVNAAQTSNSAVFSPVVDLQNAGATNMSGVVEFTLRDAADTTVVTVSLNVVRRFSVRWGGREPVLDSFTIIFDLSLTYTTSSSRASSCSSSSRTLGHDRVFFRSRRRSKSKAEGFSG
jgi:hypothetical protein